MSLQLIRSRKLPSAIRMATCKRSFARVSANMFGQIGCFDEAPGRISFVCKILSERTRARNKRRNEKQDRANVRTGRRVGPNEIQERGQSETRMEQGESTHLLQCGHSKGFSPLCVRYVPSAHVPKGTKRNEPYHMNSQRRRNSKLFLTSRILALERFYPISSILKFPLPTPRPTHSPKHVSAYAQQAVQPH